MLNYVILVILEKKHYSFKFNKDKHFIFKSFLIILFDSIIHD